MRIRITLLTNICFEPYWRLFIRDRFSHVSDDIQINVVLYEDCVDNVNILKYSDIIVVYLDFDTLYPNISNDIQLGNFLYRDVENNCLNRCREIYYYIKDNSNAKVFWFGFEDYYSLQNSIYGTLLAFDGLVDQINLNLTDIIKDDSYIDFKHIIATVGIKHSYDNKGKYRWNSPYSKEIVFQMVDEIYKQYLITNRITKKCLILDCDNVLWGGVLSDDGIEGIQISNNGIGRQFQDFQRYLLDMYYHGVILAVCSKNDQSDVLQVFREHSGMILKEKDISCFCCNWDNKPTNIKIISDILNIGVDSIVFVDDSRFEIESVNDLLPEVKTILYNKNTIYYDLDCFNLVKKVDLETVKKRTKTYQTNILRENLKKDTKDFNEYISSLKMNIDIHPAFEHELERISELTQRTNKCSNGVRYSLEKIRLILDDPTYELYSICLSDRFSDLGIVGAIGIKCKNVEMFTLSCRALGRTVEKHMIEFIKNKGAMTYDFFSTKKNETIKQLFIANGLKESK